MKTVAGIDWRGKCALLRADLNVPLVTDANGITAVTDDTRLTAIAPTVHHILKGGGGVSLLSHLGRPQEGAFDEALSLRVVADALSAALAYPVQFCSSFAKAGSGEVIVLENTRFNVGERKNDTNLARRYADCGDVFVMDAFASAHRAEASVAAVAETGIPVCIGLLVESEITALRRVVHEMRRPLVGVFGGAKISTKLPVIRHMAALCDVLIFGGGIANTLLLAQGANIGASLTQHDMLEEAKKLLKTAKAKMLLPVDAVVAASPEEETSARQLAFADIGSDDMILDIGIKTQVAYAAALRDAATIIWNGPVGLFERPAFAAGTSAVAAAVADSPGYSLIGGGDTILAARQNGVLDKLSYVSTGGGALLEYLAGNSLPGLVLIN